MINVDDIWKLDEHVRFRRLLDEGVVVHQDQAEALVLNDTAVTFLELCDGRRDTAEIINSMAEEFDVHGEILATDLEPFIAELAVSGIIHRVPVAQT